MSEAQRSEAPRAPVSRRSPAVLVVDDEADLRELLSLTLLRLGLDVDTAESVSAARSLLARNRYSLCLTDMRLPDGTGLELVREVAQSSGTPIAVITAYGSAENAVAALKAGAFDYLTKPVDLDQLRLLVRSAVRDANGVSVGSGDASREPLAAVGSTGRHHTGDATDACPYRAAGTQHGAGGDLRGVGQRQGTGGACDP